MKTKSKTKTKSKAKTIKNFPEDFGKESEKTIINSGCAERMKTLREEHGLTQAELAKKLGVSRSSVANWETGIRQPGRRSAARLAREFNVPVDYILCKSTARDVTERMLAAYVDTDKLNRKGISELKNYYEYLLTKNVYTK